MGRKSKLKKQRKAIAQNPSTAKSPSPKGDIETLNQLGYGEHNRLRSPEIPADRPEPQL
ncbi:hypothetical protein [Picosynechococcus sp. PCC 11901]|uniref:hypothetical protein n=1 Tax=Picosynechococcus sp. PCC 11901 TaxID=2579791 RepID=UPI00143DB62B|nr:hypothetical protein [Picosynechococcus sp. PCC 11901]